MAATLGLGTALLVGAGSAPAWALADPAPIVAGVSEVVAVGAIGPIFPVAQEWIPVVGGDVLLARHDQLVADAGTDPLNYLRSMIPAGYFKQNPQEFFASIANQWFVDSAKTVDLGIVRFDAGRPDPINQALFFADVYSQGTDTTWFYTTDTTPVTTRRPVTIHRNMAGRIDEIEGTAHRYRFTLDASGRVTGYVIVD